MLHSNPMDYAWGANGLDAIITQVSSGIMSYELTYYIEPKPLKWSHQTMFCDWAFLEFIIVN